MQRERRAAIFLGASLLGLGGCGASEETCAPGGACSPPGAGGGPAAAGTSGGPGGSSGSNAPGAGGEGAGLVTPPDPVPPEFPATLDRLSIAIRTGGGEHDGDGRPDDAVSLCLTDADCFTLDVAGDEAVEEKTPYTGDRQPGRTDVYHFADVGLPRSKVDRVELRRKNGDNAWRPACVEVRFDGEPVHCEDQMDVVLGNGGSEVMRWKDPKGLHAACSTCYPSPVTHGPLVGAVGPDSTRILVRTDATRKVGLRLGPPGAPDEAKVVAWAYPSPETDYTAVLEASGLEPSTAYAYVVEVDGKPASATHAFRTSPSSGAAGKFRVAMGSCTREEAQPIFGRVLASKPDAFVFLGDNHYADYKNFARLRWFYRFSLERPERAAMVATTPSVAIWDDHDFLGNDTDARDDKDPSKPDARRERALKGFREYWANAGYGTEDAPGTFSRWSWGDVDFFLLDCRYYRGIGGKFLGPAQTDWLRAGLQASAATFKIVACGSVWTWGETSGSDTWRPYKKERDALFDFVRDEKIGGVVVAGGDVHRSRFSRIKWKDKGGYDVPELVSSGLAVATGSCPSSLPHPLDAADAEMVRCYGADRSYVTLDFDTEAADPTLVATIVDRSGKPQGEWKILRSSLQP